MAPSAGRRRHGRGGGLLLALLAVALGGAAASPLTCNSVIERCGVYTGTRERCTEACAIETELCLAACGGVGDGTTLPTEECTFAVSRFDQVEMASCEPRICEEGGSGIFLPFFKTEHKWPAGVRIMLYGAGLLWFFMGVAIVSDVFMGAIEVITSRQVRVEVHGQLYHVRSWNDTVANLTLMALGSSAPEILLSIIELMGLKYYSGQLGPSTIVGSAAFNLMIICGVCVIAIPDGETRQIEHTHVYAVTASFSVFAYIWLYIVVNIMTPDIVTLVEALVTLFFFPLLVYLAYGMEKGKFDSLFGWKSSQVSPDHGRVRQITNANSGSIDTKTLADILKEIRSDQPGISEENACKMAMYMSELKTRKSRAYYRVQATRYLSAGARVGVKPPQGIKAGAAGAAHGGGTAHNESKAGDPSSKQVHEPDDVDWMGFESTAKSVYEDSKVMAVRVLRRGPCQGVQRVSYYTKDVTAEHGKDYDKAEGTLEFLDGESEKTVEIGLIEDNHYEEDETFELLLHSPEPAIKFHDEKMVVTIINVDFPGVFIFEKQHYKVCESEKKVVLNVKRIEGCSGEVSCDYCCKDETALAGADYIAMKGTITFRTGEIQKTLTIEIVDDNAYEKDETFQVILSNPTGGAHFPETTDGGEEHEICVVTIISDEGQRRLVDNVMTLMNINKDRVRLGRRNFLEQFTQAWQVNGGDGEGPASAGDIVIHIICVPWKMFFALIPPTDFANGWVCFVVSLSAIGLVTAFIGDLASLFGCVLNVNDGITAITFVALGTSLPDTFASKTAAVQDATADASIGNVTGSNSVNVFLGLGLPWLIGSLYWASKGPTEKWHALYASGDTAESVQDYLVDGAFVVPGGDLGFSVIVFTSCAMITLLVLLVRRKMYGGELGGPKVPMWLTFVLLVMLWMTYVLLSVAKDKDWI